MKNMQIIVSNMVMVKCFNFDLKAKRFQDSMIYLIQ